MTVSFDMPARPASFEERGGWVTRRLAADFNLTLEQAAGLVGNLGFESGGFEELREIGQPEGVGGYGWGQWTASRRVSFLAWAQAQKLDWRSDEANFGYLCSELRGAYHDVIVALLRCQTVEQATWSVGQTYERPGGTTPSNLPGYEGRLHWATRALAGAKAATGVDIKVNSAPDAAAQPIVIPPCRDMQRALIAEGRDLGPTGADGDWGDLSAQALADHYASQPG